MENLAKENSFFIGDTHFCHVKIIEYCNRPFKDVDEMNAELIRRWNAVVPKDGHVYHVGDFAFKATWEQVRDIRAQLNGDITLVEGNHDEAAVECQQKVPGTFKEIILYKELKFGKQKVVLFHYGMRTWHHDLRGAWHLYGHSHAKLEPYGKSFDVGVDAGSAFAPWTYAEIEKQMSLKAIGPHPQFENFKKEETTA